MTLKSFVKLFIPPILFKVKTFITRIKGMNNKGLLYSTINQIPKKSDTLCILGNGPSLVDSCETFKRFIELNEVMAVNHFCVSGLYEKIKPSCYCFADPFFFTSNHEGNEHEKYNRFIDAFFKKTDWEMNVIVPDFGIESFFYKKLRENSLFKIFVYNTKDFSTNKENLFDQYNKNLLIPPARNVLNLALYLSIFLKYKEVYLFGAENSFMNDLHVDQKDNKLYFMYKHFYDEGKKIYLYYDDSNPGLGIMKLHEFLSEHSKTMKLYWDLLEYSNYNNVKIYNASEYSLIDAFERKKPE